jgi:hypothetical protein
MSNVLKCDVCDKEFSSKSTLSTHQKTAKFCLAKKASMASNASHSTPPPTPPPTPSTQPAIASTQPTVASAASSVVQDDATVRVTHPKDGNFIEEIKRHYEDKIRVRDERISSLESLIEKMEAKLARYQTTIVSIVLKSMGGGTYRRLQRCSDPECKGCRTEEAIEEQVDKEMDGDDSD